jgi:hypothetical protein
MKPIFIKFGMNDEILTAQEDGNFFGSYFQYLDCKASNDRVTDEQWIGRDLEGSAGGLIEIISQNLRDGTEIRTE